MLFMNNEGDRETEASSSAAINPATASLTLSDILSFDEYQEGAITLNPQFKEDSNASTNFDFVLFSRSLNGGDLRSIEPDSHWNRE